MTELGLELDWSADRPVTYRWVDVPPPVRGAMTALVDLFTAHEQRERSGQGYARSAIGERLRHVGHQIIPGAGSTRLLIEQRDERSGLTVVTGLERPDGLASLRVTHEVTNGGTEPVTLTALTSLAIGIGEAQADLDRLRLFWGESEWLAEGRWHGEPLRAALPELDLGLHGQDGRGRWFRTSQGSWSSGSWLPTIALAGPVGGLAAQIEAGAPWHVELHQTLGGAALVLTGPTEAEHGFAVTLDPGESFASVPVSVAFHAAGRDGALGTLTAHRRWLRADRAAQPLPVIYNDFMNTLMGDPTTERLLPLVDAAAMCGAEYFCIDAGWFADPDIGDWWSTVGEWREAPTRFSGGLRQVIEAIHARGMRSGIWLEPEVIGVHSPVAAQLPDTAYFHRWGSRVREANRYHLDFRHPAARAHLDATVDHLVAEYGISFLKLDYNINPGAGTDVQATSAAQGLLGHALAYREWLVDLGRRHPDLLVENCASGAMRMDYGLLAVTHLQSTSDQQDFRLYPPIAASAPASLAPEQCGNWAYPAADMSLEETAFAMVAGIMGRLYLSGFLGRLRPEQVRLVQNAVAVHKELRTQVATSLPVWPCDLPGWTDDLVVLGLDVDGDRLLAVWSRADTARRVDIPGRFDSVTQLYPSPGLVASWGIGPGCERLVLDIPAGFRARIFRLVGGANRPRHDGGATS